MSARVRSVASTPLHLFVMLLVLAFALGGSGKPAAAGVDTPHSPGGEVVVALNADIATLDPAVTSDRDTLSVASQLYDRLTALDPTDGHVLPGLASSWSVSPDGLTWTFAVRSGVTFHDGTPLNADAIVFNLMRWWDTNNAYHTGDFPYWSSLFGYQGDEGTIVSAITKVNANTLSLTLRQRDTTVPAKFAMPAFSIASPAAVQAGTLANTGVGTGPYKLGERVAGDHIRLLANTAYWGAAPRSAPLTFRIMPGDPSLQWSGLQLNTIQVAAPLSDPQDALDLIRSDSRLAALWREDGDVGYLGINQGRTPFNNALVRQAIAYAIDKPALVAGQYGPAAYAAYGLLPNGLWGAPAIQADYIHDASMAQQLLDQAGYPHGFSTDLYLRDAVRGYMPNPTGVATAIAADLATAGITVTVHVLPASEFLDRVYSGDLDLFLLGWGADVLHPANYFEPILCGPFAALGPHDTTLCNQLAAAQQLSDPAAQAEVYRNASAYVHSNVPLVPLAHTRTLLGQNRSVLGFIPSPVAADPFPALAWVTNWTYLPSMMK